jgi:hypothetical protein
MRTGVTAVRRYGGKFAGDIIARPFNGAVSSGLLWGAEPALGSGNGPAAMTLMAPLPPYRLTAVPPVRYA